MLNQQWSLWAASWCTFFSSELSGTFARAAVRGTMWDLQTCKVVQASGRKATSCECQEPAADKDPQSVKSDHKKCGVFGRIVGHLQQEQPQRNRPTKGHLNGPHGPHGSCFFGMANSIVNEQNPTVHPMVQVFYWQSRLKHTSRKKCWLRNFAHPQSSSVSCELKNSRTVAGSGRWGSTSTALLPRRR